MWATTCSKATAADGDLLVGGNGDDQLNGGGGPDTLAGGADGDTYLFDSRAGPVDGVCEQAGRGIDVLSFEFDAAEPVQVDLSKEAIVAQARNLEVHLAERGTVERGVLGQRSVWRALTTPSSVLRIAEAPRAGFDTIDLADQILTSTTSGSRLESQLDRVRVDLSAADWIIRAEHVGARAARRGGARHLEGVRGTTGPDVLIGNDANNVLEGRQGPTGSPVGVAGIRASPRATEMS